MGMDPPNVRNTKGRGFVIRHREFLTDVSSATSFTLSSYPINPGLATTFPWLSTIAQNFEEWVPLGILFEFKSTSADALNSTNTALGTIIMATEYNSNNDNFINKAQMENYEFATSTRPSCSALHPIECDPRLNPMATYYIRAGSPPTGADLKFYDVGNFQFAATGSQAAAVVGELWITYEILFRKPKINEALVSAAVGDHFTASSGISTSAYFGTSPVNSNTDNPLGCSLGTAAITFPSHIPFGNYLIVYQVKGSSTASVNPPTLNYTTNTQGVNVWNGGTNPFAYGPSTTTNDRFCIVWTLQITGPGAVVTLSSGTLPSSATAMDLLIIPISAQITR
jgi:hypothetical protein